MVHVISRNPDPFPSDVCVAIYEHAKREFPRESCGIVVEDDGEFLYVPCENIHPEPELHFEIDPQITAEWMQRGALRACVHSHPNGPNYPTFNDEQQQIASGVPWGVVPIIGATFVEGVSPPPEDTNLNEPPPIIPVPSEIVWWGDQLPRMPLENRQFVWAVFDCWALVRDFYLEETGIFLYEIPCHDNFIERGDDMFLQNVENAGLRNLGKIDMAELRRGDILLGHLKGEFPNHAGVYLGGDDFLHHPPHGVSGKANLLRWWPHIDTVLRHDGFDEAKSVWAARGEVRAPA